MKIRDGFVSNSSSSSFCIVGVSGDMARLLLSRETNSQAPRTRPNHGENCECSKCKAWARYSCSEVDRSVFERFSHGRFCPGSDMTVNLEYYGEDGYVHAAGVDAVPLLKTMTLPEACEYVRSRIWRELAVDIPFADFGLQFGEAGEG